MHPHLRFEMGIGLCVTFLQYMAITQFLLTVLFVLCCLHGVRTVHCVRRYLQEPEAGRAAQMLEDGQSQRGWQDSLFVQKYCGPALDLIPGDREICPAPRARSEMVYNAPTRLLHSHFCSAELSGNGQNPTNGLEGRLQDYVSVTKQYETDSMRTT